jgi:hypothetical protein
MTVTYDLTTLIGQIRLMIGDNNIVPITNAVFTDEEITFFLTANGSDLNLTAEAVCMAWAAKYGANVDSETIGDYSYRQTILDKLLKMANAFAAAAALLGNAPAMDWAEMDLDCVGEDE